MREERKVPQPQDFVDCGAVVSVLLHRTLVARFRMRSAIVTAHFLFADVPPGVRHENGWVLVSGVVVEVCLACIPNVDYQWIALGGTCE